MYSKWLEINLLLLFLIPIFSANVIFHIYMRFQRPSFSMEMACYCSLMSSNVGLWLQNHNTYTLTLSPLLHYIEIDAARILFYLRFFFSLVLFFVSFGIQFENLFYSYLDWRGYFFCAESSKFFKNYWDLQMNKRNNNNKQTNKRAQHKNKNFWRM